MSNEVPEMEKASICRKNAILCAVYRVFPPISNKTIEYNAIYNKGVTKAPTMTVYHV